MKTTQRPDATPMPRIWLRKGFMSLPFAYQWVVYGSLLLTFLVFLPGMLDAAKLDRGIRPAIAMPKDTEEFATRLVSFYSLEGIQHIPQQRSRGILALAQLMLCWSTAYAGASVHRRDVNHRPSQRCIGGSAHIRARVAVRERT